MTILVGYLPEREGESALEYAVMLARAVQLPLTVATVVPKQWETPSMAKVDGEFAAYAAEVADRAQQKAKEALAQLSEDIEWSFTSLSGRSASSALIEAAHELDPSLLVIGASADGGLGRVVIGSTADRLLHSSPVPLAIAPRGYQSSNAPLSRITFGFSGDEASRRALMSARKFADDAQVPLRIVTVGIRMQTMMPSEIGLHAEDAVLAAWIEQAQQAQQLLLTEELVAPDTDMQVVSGPGWREALANLDWWDGEILALGSSAVGPIARVFLGSRATKLIRHAPVPVLVLESRN